jgi:lipopolysaccharide/colanic/teichoic acid biosynthesis glycosyltransferase
MIDPSARLIGSVVVQRDAIVEAGAQVIGPTVIGPEARIGRGAIVAQCMVARGSRVAAESVIRHRALSGHSSAVPMDVLEPMFDAPVDPPPAEAPAKRIYPACKVAFDVIAAALGLIVLSPLLLIVAIIIKLESKGPVLYGDQRETIGGRRFRCWKFRTMYEGAQAKQRELLQSNMVDGPQFKMQKDPRVTRVGRWLRGYNIDELPQLLNVLRAEMSLVGPRPSPFRENQICVPWREGRLSVRAGITGLWQVCREERKAGDFHQWILYDLLYVRHMSPLLDFRILIATVLTLAGGRRVPASRVLGARASVRAEGETGADRVLYDSVRA